MQDKFLEYLKFQLIDLDKTVSKRGISGYDPQLFWLLPFSKLHSKYNSLITNLLRKSELFLVWIFPFLSSVYLRLLNIPMVVNTYGLGLAVRAYINYFKIFGDDIYLHKALNIEKEIYKRLVKTQSGNLGVTDPLNIEKVCSLPGGSEVALAYIELYKATNQQSYLNMAQSIAKSFMSDHRHKFISEDKLCLDYSTANDGYHVLNANALACEVFAELDDINSSNKYEAVISKIVNYIEPYLSNDSLPYSGVEDKGKSDINWSTCDVYHSGFVLRSLYRVSCLRNDSNLQNKILSSAKLLSQDFLSKNNKILYVKDGKIIDIHGVAEFIRCLSLVLPEIDESTLKILVSNIKYMRCSDSFYYRRGIVKTFYYMPRWGHFPMMLAISELVLRIIDLNR